ncbi:hypothetical protein DMUE_5076, partial [Dictyocoela muelleri]
KFTYYFFKRDHFKQSSILENCELSDEGYLTILNLFRRKIKKFINDNPIKIGEPFKEIQIDESPLAKRKYGIGRYSEPIWIFWIIEVKTNIVYLEKVKSRDAKTLVPIINSKIEKKSYIISDQWSAYNFLEQFGYFKNTICHKKNFVNLISNANTQKIENVWMHLKKIKYYSYGINIDTIDDHLSIFMFFWNYRNIDLSIL